jgi:outer membrane receptor protein involved in Fe transport
MFIKIYTPNLRPGYTIMNFRANFTYENDIRVSLAVENLFDKEYYDHLSYGWQHLDYASQGRNVKFELNYLF